jgi:SAM-dependent methyltransferase
MTDPGGLACPLCRGSRTRRVGIRGNREYLGADPRTEPHLVADVLRCSECDFFFVHPSTPEADRLASVHYADPQRYTGFEGIPRSALHQRLDLIESYGTRGRLLDIGAGRGEFVRAAADAGWIAEGIEPSAPLASYAREHGATVRTGHLGAVPEITPTSFEAVTLLHVIEHVSDPRALLTMARSYLRPDGVLFVEVPNCDSYLLRFVDAYYRIRRRNWSSRLSPFHPPYHSYGYTKTSLLLLLRDTGYDLKKIGTFSAAARGCGLSGSAKPLHLVRSLGARVLDNIGNRELLYAVARTR